MMTEFDRLSNREREVLKLVLQGKSNKQIASSLNISVRTVEFHLQNIYAKFHVSSRVELILLLWNATGTVEIEKPGFSTVDQPGNHAHNGDRRNSWTGWTVSFRKTVSMFGKELKMKNHLLSRHVFVAIITALFTGLLWLTVLRYNGNLSLLEAKTWAAPLIVALAMVGLSIGWIGKSKGCTLRRICFSTLFGTGLSPFLIIPLMLTVVLPLGKLAEWLGFIDPSTMSGEIATTLTIVAAAIIWSIVGFIIGITLLFVTLRQPGSSPVQLYSSENGS